MDIQTRLDKDGILRKFIELKNKRFIKVEYKQIFMCSRELQIISTRSYTINQRDFEDGYTTIKKETKKTYRKQFDIHAGDMKMIVLKETAYGDEIILGCGIDFIVYHYESGSYEGDGYALYYMDDHWYMYNMGHCSCYGPFDSFPEDSVKFTTLKKAKEKLLKDNISGYYNIDINQMIELAQEWSSDKL